MVQKIASIIYSFILLIPIIGFSQDIPGWVSNRPISKEYYIGIGYCKISTPSYEEIAKRKALDDLVSEISSNVKSEMLLTESESDRNYNSNFSSSIQISSNIEIEGYELIDTWKNEEFYWVYYQLSKEKYYDLLKNKVKSDYISAENLFYASSRNLKDGNISTSISQMYSSLEIINKNSCRHVESEFKEKSLVLRDIICEQLANVFHRLKIESIDVIESEYPVKTIVPLNYRIVYLDSINNIKNVPNIPLTLYFENGTGVLSDSILLSNDSGFANFHLLTLSTFSDIYVIIAEIQTNSLFKDCYKECNFENLRKRVIIKPIKSKVFITSNEFNQGRTVSPKIIEPILSNYLIENGLEITAKREDADYLILISSDTRKGSQTNGICTSFLQISVELKNRNGSLIFSDSKNNLKGLKLNYNDAGLNAYERNLQVIESELLNKLISSIIH